MTEEDVTPTWDIDHYFKHIYNPHRSPRATKSLTGKGIKICPWCVNANFEKFFRTTDVRGRVYKTKVPKLNRLQLVHIPCTGQNVQYCRFCGSVWPEYRDDPISGGGLLEMYLALLGVIQFVDYDTQ
ncbi:MAG: hypothetical protein LBI18_07115 [Planctomycetaceae bacterium]|jgi:hypothetical protein|nr:hypothetical protein [Planctomycetaceae bacterium]